ncbi:MAG: hypothetical protein R3Y26_09835 [Rikenellaceae bacterium]
MKSVINLPENIVTQKVSLTKLVTLTTLIAVISILALLIALVDFENYSYLSQLIITACFICTIVVLFLGFSLKQDVHAESGSPLISKTIDFPASKYTEVSVDAKSNNWLKLDKIKTKPDDTIMKLELTYSKDRSFVAYQFFHYVPYIYEPCSEIYYLDKSNFDL